MAKDTAKKNWRRNEVRMKTFTIITAAVNIIYCAVVLHYRGGYIRMVDVLSVLFWAGQEYYCLRALQRFAAPTFAPDGSLQRCPDVSDPAELGIYTFAQDMLWVCWLVQTLCNLHHAFIVFYLPVPATIIYKGYTLARPFLPGWLGGAVQQQEGREEDQAAPQTREERRREAIKRRKGRHFLNISCHDLSVSSHTEGPGFDPVLQTPTLARGCAVALAKTGAAWHRASLPLPPPLITCGDNRTKKHF
eukprot:gene10747-7475_t